MSLTLRYMRNADIPEVMAIEQVSFNPPWTARSYSYEINESTYSHMVALEHSNGQSAPAGWKKLLGAIAAQPPANTKIVGYGGLWFISGEGHISTIASHPDMRGHGYGELVFAAMLHRSITLDADYMILEVRVSNVVAQNLYKKYGFRVEGVKPKYYQSNNEDAYDMRLQIRGVRDFVPRFNERYAELLDRHGVIDLYSTAEFPAKESR
ncbi:MAG: ribosomal-protein-alanine acetyltransferase [Chloroflexi bacterium OLB15]|nr:MAG: ribosomal-protein-alanine acetyltransferase [Chloroflexi bacterium OLB15]